MLYATLLASAAFVLHAPLAGRGSSAAAASGACAASMMADSKARLPTEPTITDMATYLQARAKDVSGQYGPTLEEVEQGFLEFIAGGGDSEFDGGDSGGGAVGDGNTDLEDQHNSASIVRPKHQPWPSPQPQP